MPNETYLYTWIVPEAVAPTENDPSCLMWVYHSNVDSTKDTHSGKVSIFPVISCNMNSCYWSSWSTFENKRWTKLQQEHGVAYWGSCSSGLSQGRIGVWREGDLTHTWFLGVPSICFFIDVMQAIKAMKENGNMHFDRAVAVADEKKQQNRMNCSIVRRKFTRLAHSTIFFYSNSGLWFPHILKRLVDYRWENRSRSQLVYSGILLEIAV